MYDVNDPVVSTKKTIIEHLKNIPELSYLDIIENHPADDLKLPLQKPLISIGRSKITSTVVSFNNYLGETFKEDDCTSTERIGKSINIYFDIHLWNGTAKNMGGEREIERLEGKLVKIFELKEPPEGIIFEKFETGEIEEDPDVEVFHCRCILKTQVLIYEDSTGAAIDEINLKGSVINE